MTADDLEVLFGVALPPLKLASRGGYHTVRRSDPGAEIVADAELATVERGRSRLARHGWWN